MHIVFIITLAANLILAVIALIIAPSPMAIHFGPGGYPNGWAPAHVNALIMSGTNTLMFVIFYFAPALIRKTPARWVNLPNKNYWLKDENRAGMEKILAGQLHLFGSATLLFMFMIGLLALQANLSNPVRLREDLFFWVLGIYLVYTVYWTIKLIMAFRLPKKKTGSVS